MEKRSPLVTFDDPLPAPAPVHAPEPAHFSLFHGHLHGGTPKAGSDPNPLGNVRKGTETQDPPQPPESESRVGLPIPASQAPEPLLKCQVVGWKWRGLGASL